VVSGLTTSSIVNGVLLVLTGPINVPVEASQFSVRNDGLLNLSSLLVCMDSSLSYFSPKVSSDLFLNWVRLQSVWFIGRSSLLRFPNNA